ncbi:mannose-1-phosphate guanylyltransferase (GDP) /mannose-6-phosphate isomerase, type 2 [Pseudomonas duriflava]|uniref:Alginate biosynthesis protein AlgA n=1 Tax=Pseudomonas duriflava TaxID=459528 RepID=A0A562QNT7_9PSED|nr:mannose-1-phosphate guanylyltransferase/mannose-6-phosphate isomerase [Pseudomonas duriflava]TWI58428.1 mannose-1-phosphate guanylyltransferase (GDP) /mannose-6-phosphate isomerase, type 2 [Pseudomonas duriflava]
MIPVILSGGSGSRLWPLSRKMYPKQFLALTSEKTLFQETISRLACDERMEKPLIVCNVEHRYIVEEQLKTVTCQPDSLIMEPFGRNTAPAVAIAAMKLVADGKDELMLVLPADHVIENIEAFKASLHAANEAAEKGEMVLFGIPAVRPETGYGYIKANHSDKLPEGVNRVERFVEKPDAIRATQYVESGDYYWNSGIFLFRASRYLEELKLHDPDIYDTCLLTLERSQADGDHIIIDRNSFAVCPDNSIDYAVMEKTTRACVVPMSAGWNDVGSWSAIWDVHNKDTNGNVVKGDVVLHDSQNCLVHSNGKLVSLIGVENIVVVETKDAVMIVHKDKVQDVKKVVNKLEEQGRQEVKSHLEVFRPWGSYDSVDMGHRFQVKRITVKPGAQLSLQMHHHRAEHWIVVSGTAQVTCDDKTFLLTENQSTYLPMTSVHRLANPGKVPLEIIEVQSGGYLGEDDIVRYEDVYGRVDAPEVKTTKAIAR